MKKILFILTITMMLFGCEIFLKDVENINISAMASDSSVKVSDLGSLTFTLTLETENTSGAPITLKSYKVSSDGEKEEFSGISLIDKDDSRELSGLSFAGAKADDSFQVYFYFETEQDVEIIAVSPTITVLAD